VGAGGWKSAVGLANRESAIDGILTTGAGIATVIGAGGAGRPTDTETGGSPGAETGVGTETSTLGRWTLDTWTLGTET
jgi:hypothetical protein